jgi:hypothetical protein
MSAFPLGQSVFVGGDNALTLILATFGAGMVGQLGFTASRAGSYGRGIGFFVGASFIPF